MTISAGDKLPEATLKIATADGPKEVGVGSYFGGRKVVLFGVPGAFTPTCSNNHLPGYLENRDAILRKGVDAIAVVAVNDPFVMGAWARASGGEGKIDYLSDGNGDFARAMGLDTDMSKGGMGTRVRRFSMIVDDGIVKAVNVEEKPGVEATGATRILELL
ncbi:MAG: peroxiredoxin [Rhizobiales bacterium]|jgi:peroxiredoxin|nr:peroxiredoxin [Hyphomicrobiales bacterium]OJU31249.1 MAG: peroxiredoxin [Rhizobiales bacterium 68-8]